MAIINSAAQCPNTTESLSVYGIPYAKPPVGTVRFQPPQAHGACESLRDATTMGQGCMQKASSELISEACLFLNVATPQKAIGAVTKLPVMFGSMEVLTRVEPRLSIQLTPLSGRVGTHT